MEYTDKAETKSTVNITFSVYDGFVIVGRQAVDETDIETGLVTKVHKISGSNKKVEYLYVLDTVVTKRIN